jgi:hypothetical protein
MIALRSPAVDHLPDVQTGHDRFCRRRRHPPAGTATGSAEATARKRRSFGAAVGALRKSNYPPSLFVRASRIACIEATELGRPFIADFDDTKTRHYLAQAADFFELSPRGVRREVPPPIDVAKNVRARNPATWGFPVLEGRRAGARGLVLLYRDGFSAA